MASIVFLPVEKGKTRLAVLAFALKPVMAAEVPACIVLNHQQALRFEQFAFEDKGNKALHIVQLIGRVGEDVVIGRAGALQKAQDVFAHHPQRPGFPQLFAKRADVLYTAGMPVHAGYVFASPGEQFKGMTAGSCKQVQCPDFFKVEAIGQDVKQ